MASACKKDLLQFTGVQALNSHTNSRLNKICFVDSNTCIVVGGEKFDRSDIVVSNDGGYTWNDYSFLAAPKGMYSLAVSPSRHIYTSGYDAHVIYSPDRGHNWQTRYIDRYAFYVGASFPADTVGYFVSTIGQDSGAIVKVDTNLNVRLYKRTLIGLNDIKMFNTKVGYVIGYGAILKTSDAGQTWNYLATGGEDNFFGMDVHSENDAWFCGYAGGITHTTDGGQSFTWLRNGNDITIPSYRLYDIVFRPDDLSGWAVGGKGLVIHTTDGGNHWAQYEKFTDSDLFNIAICPNGDLLISGDNGTLFRLKP